MRAGGRAAAVVGAAEARAMACNQTQHTILHEYKKVSTSFFFFFLEVRKLRSPPELEAFGRDTTVEQGRCPLLLLLLQLLLLLLLLVVAVVVLPIDARLID